MTPRASRVPILAILAVAVSVGLAVSPLWANDSSAELSVGGLLFTKNADVSMESEELTISPEQIIVRYKFLNQSQKPVTLTVAFPLPDIDLAEADNYAIPVNDPANFLGFQTKVDGKPITFTMQQRAMLGDKDVSAAIRNAGLPLLPLGPHQDRISELPQATKDKLLDAGLLVPFGQTDAGKPIYEAGWIVKTSAVRQQTFPPGKPVMVEHRYRPSVGASFDTVLRKGLRTNKGMAQQIDRYRKDYCVSEPFLASLDKLAGAPEANTSKVGERRINYILKTGANWAGPIKNFHMVIDKRKADRLISFCVPSIAPSTTAPSIFAAPPVAPSMKSISATSVEVTAKDFTPDKDLKILIVGRF